VCEFGTAITTAYPSGGDLATKSAAIDALAPVRFSTITD
jgi:hypothetical protein